MLWHRLCYSNFTNQTNLARFQKRKTEVQHQDDGPVSKRRSSLSPMDWSKCMFCQENSQALSQVQTKDTSDGIIRRVPFDPIMSVKLAGVTDLIAFEGKYHLKCYTKFKRSTDRTTLKSTSGTDHKEECFKEIMSLLDFLDYHKEAFIPLNLYGHVTLRSSIQHQN